jgi:zinc transport system substrate-binding protein
MHSTMASKLPPVELDHEAEDSVEEFDEHFWLDPSLLAVQAEAVRDVLTDIDPEHAAEYKARALAFVAELSGLDKEYREGLASCEKRVAVTSHAAFGYVARAYAFEQLPISGVSPEEEPSAGELADLVEEARQYKVAYVFFETLVNPKLAQTLAEEIGAQTLVFNPIEGLTPEETDRGEDYFSIMRENLANLRTAMICR